ncbi:type IV secretory system conjugative DNA transfer family protein [Streptomyces sp. NPDC018045]|uniref:type IV secretory system conjugative DNA transfer family protein n=1 Tax=Streptomyces sp. NPDC018045 TaxID=3365037 RepID=UPI00379F87B8
MSATSKRRGPGEVPPYLVPGFFGFLFLAVGALWLAALVGAGRAGLPAPPANPFSLPFLLIAGTYTWPGLWANITLGLETAAVAAAAALVVRAVRKRRKGRLPIDAAARHMAKGRELEKISGQGARATATRLGIPADRVPGVFLGNAVYGGTPLYGSVEDTHVHIWGPRTGKTTRLAVPPMLDHKAAPCLVTSNRRDIVDATRLPRSQHGQVWVFDLQGLIGEEPTWYYDPLSYVTDITRATQLAAAFASNSRSAGARTDAYFEPAGQKLLANLLLAAKLGDKPITTVYEWVSDSNEDEPERILSGAGPQYRLAAKAVLSVLNLHEKQRGGIYGTAEQMASCLQDPALAPWITRGTGLDKRPAFDPAAFVRGTDTLYLISKDRQGSTGALITALTLAVCEAAEEYASRSPRGRLPVPLLGVLDEAANVCRWEDLPSVYSHYGSRGINLMTILQSWDQGVEAWGEHGMAKLWSSANVRTYGGGVSDDGLLSMLKKQIGSYERPAYSHSRQPGNGGGLFASNRSVSVSEREEAIVDYDDLAAMPQGRAVLLASGTRPVLMQTVGWWEHPDAALVNASLKRHDPGALSTS